MKNYTLTTILIFVSMVVFAQKPKVIATTTIISDITAQIAGDKVAIECLVPVGGDPHLFEPIPQDAIKVSKANLILMNGLTLEGWLKEFIDNSGTKAKTVTTTEGIQAIESTAYANSPDPHAWMDASNGILYAENIKNALVELDGENKDFYEANFKNYKQQLEELDIELQAMIDSIPTDKRVLITSHDAFQYYGRKYNIRLESILGTSTDAEAQTSDINRLYKVINETKVPAIFVESTINPQTMMQIARDTKIRIGGKLYADSLGQPDSEAGTYIGMLRWNTRNIMNALLGRLPLEEEKITSDNSSGGSMNWIIIGLIGTILIGGTWYMMRKV